MATAQNAINNVALLAANNLSDLANAATARANLGVSVQQGSVFIVSPANITIPLISSSCYAFTINGIDNLQVASGSITATIQINGTNVTGLSGLSVTSTPQSPTASGANTVSVGNRVTLVLSSNAGATNLEFTMQGTR